MVTELQFYSDNVTDLSPVRALRRLKALLCNGSRWDKRGKLSDLSPLKQLKLTTLACYYTQVSDLSPLQGMPLAFLNCGSTQVSDLSPLKGMPLTALNCGTTQVSDLSPLQGMKLGDLHCDHTQVSDLSSLRGMPLSALWIQNTLASDLSPLEGMNLNEILLTPRNVTKGLDLIRQMQSLQRIGFDWDDKSHAFRTAEFAWKYDAGEFRR